MTPDLATLAAAIEIGKANDLLEKLRTATTATTAEYPPELLATRRAEFVASVREHDQREDSDGLWMIDPRTPEQKNLDEWQADWQSTNESNRP